jgi:hypothetical protein
MYFNFRSEPEETIGKLPEEVEKVVEVKKVKNEEVEEVVETKTETETETESESETTKVENKTIDTMTESPVFRSRNEGQGIEHRYDTTGTTGAVRSRQFDQIGLDDEVDYDDEDDIDVFNSLDLAVDHPFEGEFPYTLFRMFDATDPDNHIFASLTADVNAIVTRSSSIAELLDYHNNQKSHGAFVFYSGLDQSQVFSGSSYTV